MLGFVGDLDWAGLQGNQDGLNDAVNFPASFYNHTTDINMMGSLRVRAGMVLPLNLLLYATGGYAFARTENSIGFSGAASPFLTYDETRNGWTIGGGVEGYVLPNVTISLEYRFTQFEGGLVLAPAVNARDNGLPHVSIPRVTLDSGRSWPASGLAGAAA